MQKTLGWLVLLGALLTARAGAADEANALTARLECHRRPTPGRVLCEVELEVESGVLSWGDVLVIEAPDFAAPLRSRVGPSASLMKSERRLRLQFALGATRAGAGTLQVRARAVLCPEAASHACRPAVTEASAVVIVGPITE